MSWAATMTCSRPCLLIIHVQLIPSDIKWDPNATPPQFTNNEDTVIEPGTHVRVKIIGTRTEVGEMWAIGSIKEDYLGYAEQPGHDTTKIIVTRVLTYLQMLTRLRWSQDEFLCLLAWARKSSDPFHTWPSPFILHPGPRSSFDEFSHTLAMTSIRRRLMRERKMVDLSVWQKRL